MTSIKAATKTSNMNLDDYTNTNTGEQLSSEIQGKIIQVKEKTQQFIINNDEYIVFNSDAIEYLSKKLNNSEMVKVFTMSNMVMTDCSIVTQDNNHPHTSDTLSLTLNMEISKFYKLIRKLVKENILSYAVCAPSGWVQKIYMLNPYIARKRKTINCEMKTFFRDVTKDKITA